MMGFLDREVNTDCQNAPRYGNRADHKKRGQVAYINTGFAFTNKADNRTQNLRDNQYQKEITQERKDGDQKPRSTPDLPNGTVESMTDSRNRCQQ
jgi:hypothetical protein